ncbi:MAG: hypothetical protein HYV66_03225 [Candidatus Sungbacteria bacterium]|uniref:Cytochrome C biogenesis protein transmembrane domain-containing protein n=1 Tax=Candidatus Sungiibacteriota bacterium TaxID=2750080 RepID=A0A931YE15_9BACT|nr:hypothetical protein [Candidatus Sungbacteria bacterium]
MKSKLIILVIIITVLVGSAIFLGNTSASSRWLWNLSDGGKLMLPLVTVAALIDSINPCAFSILLLTIAFLFSLGKMRSGILKIGASYIFGLFAVYVLIGLGIVQVLHLFDTPHFMAKAGAALLVILGLINLINHYFSGFPIKLKIPDAAHRYMAVLMEKASLPTAFLLGGLVGLCEFPCTGGPYLMILGLLHDRSTYVNGLGYLIFYNIIFILPLVIILAIASNKNLLEKMENWKKQETGRLRLWSGLAMVGLGILIFFL